MSANDAHPWTPVRHLAEELYKQMKKDFPEADNSYLLTESLNDCEDAWNTIMTEEQKIKYIRIAEEDRAYWAKESAKANDKTGTGNKKSKKLLDNSIVKKKKKPKDPNKPKKPMGAFFVFLNEKRNSIKQEFPDLTGTPEIGKKASEIFKSMPEPQKLMYVKRFETELAKYEEEMVEYCRKEEANKI